MDTVNQRLSFFIKEIVKSKSLRAFDIEIGVAENHTNTIVGKKQNIPNGIYFQKLKAKYPNLSLDWLISGDGEMFDSSKSDLEDRTKVLEENKRLESEVQNLRSKLDGLLLMASSMANQHVNFQPVSNRTPARKRVIVSQLPLFASSVANSTWLSAL